MLFMNLKFRMTYPIIGINSLFIYLILFKKYAFYTPENKSGVISLEYLIIREQAGSESNIYLITMNHETSDMYELKVQQPNSRADWILSIR